MWVYVLLLVFVQCHICFVDLKPVPGAMSRSSSCAITYTYKNHLIFEPAVLPRQCHVLVKLPYAVHHTSGHAFGNTHIYHQIPKHPIQYVCYSMARTALCWVGPVLIKLPTQYVTVRIYFRIWMLRLTWWICNACKITDAWGKAKYDLGADPENKSWLSNWTHSATLTSSTGKVNMSSLRLIA